MLLFVFRLARQVSDGTHKQEEGGLAANCIVAKQSRSVKCEIESSPTSLFKREHLLLFLVQRLLRAQKIPKKRVIEAASSCKRIGLAEK